MTYYKMPQKAIDVHGKEILYSITDVIEGAIAGNDNCSEWLHGERVIEKQWRSRRSGALPPESTLICTRCGQTKNVERFSRMIVTARDGRQFIRYESRCKACQSSRAAEYAKKKRCTPKWKQR